MPNFNLNFELFSKNISLFFSLSSKSVTMKKINYVKLRNEDFVGRMYEIARRRRLFGEPISRNLIITEALGSRPQRYYVSLTHACVTLRRLAGSDYLRQGADAPRNWRQQLWAELAGKVSRYRAAHRDLCFEDSVAYVLTYKQPDRFYLSRSLAERLFNKTFRLVSEYRIRTL